MITHHPDLNMLTEYSSGALDWALSLGISTHLHFCSDCQRKLHQLNLVGGSLLNEVQPVSVDDNALAQIMDKIKLLGSSTETAPPKTQRTLHKSILQDRMLQNLPKTVQKLLPENKPIKWKFVSPALRMARLVTGQQKYEVAFHRIGVGGKVAEHDHKGLEVTVVLKGCFSDGDGVYNEGDFLVRTPGEIHRPTAAQHQDCLCFSIVEAPVQLTGLVGKLINPFLSIRPA